MCEIKHRFPCSPDARSEAVVYGHLITKFSRMDGFLSYGAPPTRAREFSFYACIAVYFFLTTKPSA